MRHKRIKLELGEVDMFRHRWLLIAAAALLAGGLFTVWMIRYVDRQMRNDLLLQAELVARAVDIDRIKTLTGTAADLNSPDFCYLNTQLANIKAANPKYRYLYLMGRSEGQIVFLLDVAVADDGPPSQPGDVYEEASEELFGIFDTQTPFVEGPLTDEWGVWVSAHFPFVDPETGKTAAILGIDIDAQDWMRQTALRSLSAAMGFGLFAVLVVVAAVGGHYRVLIKTRASLEQSERQLRTILNGIPDIISLQKPDHTVIFYNKAGCETLRLTEKEAVGRKCFELLGRSVSCRRCAAAESLATCLPAVGRLPGFRSRGRKRVPAKSLKL